MKTISLPEKHRELIIGLLCLGILQVCDVLTTLHMAGLHGNEIEANPIAGFFLDRGWLWQMKVVVFTTIGLIFWSKRDNEKTMKCVKVAIALYCFVVAWNMTGML